MAGIAALPVVDARSPDEPIGYDDAGLPTGEFQRFCDRIGEQAEAPRSDRSEARRNSG